MSAAMQRHPDAEILLERIEKKARECAEFTGRAEAKMRVILASQLSSTPSTEHFTDLAKNLAMAMCINDEIAAALLVFIRIFPQYQAEREVAEGIIAQENLARVVDKFEKSPELHRHIAPKIQQLMHECRQQRIAQQRL